MNAHLSLSTNWNSRSMDDGRGLVDAAHDLGLDALELGYALTNRQADDIRAAVAARDIAITSVHAFCPLPMGATEGHPELFSICLREERERKRAVEAVLNSARFAAEVGAKALVLHAGRVPELVHAAKDLEKLACTPPVPPPSGGFLSRLFRHTPPAAEGVRGSLPPVRATTAAEGVRGNLPPVRATTAAEGVRGNLPPAFVKLRDKLIEQRSAKAAKYLDALRTSLDEILPTMEELGLRLGLENLPTYDAIPTEPEMFQLLQEFDSPALGYWHDLGHGQVRANLGFIHHVSVVRRLAPHMVGMHIHDVIPPATDHVMPPLGNTNFPALSFLGKLDIPAVLEPAPDTPAEDIRAAIAFLRDVWK